MQTKCQYEQSSGPKCVNEQKGHICGAITKSYQSRPVPAMDQNVIIVHRGKAIFMDRSVLEAVMDYARTEANQRLGSGLYESPKTEREWIQLVRDSALDIANLVEY